LVTNEQLYLALGVPLLFNGLLAGLLIAYVNAKIAGVSSSLGARLDAMGARLDAMDAKSEERYTAEDARLIAIDKRFDDMRDLWRAELHRVEEILDARLKPLEERLS
jgi:hypothetical protein